MLSAHRLRQIIIAAYLHDMGKLMRRGGYNRDTQFQCSLNDITDCDVITGTISAFSVAHAQHVLEYILGLGHDQYKGSIYVRGKRFWQEIAVISALHHGRDKSEYISQVNDNLHDAINIVYHADNMSSTERNEREDDEKNHSVKTTPLTSIFEVIFGQQNKDEKYIYHPGSLSDKETTCQPSKYTTNVDFEKLASGFLAGLDLLMIQGKDFDDQTSLEKLDARISQCDLLCQEYMTLVPSDAYTSERADISLYDHTKLVVANAVVLYHTHIQTPTKRSQSSGDITQKTNVSLIGTDLPGIQAYLDQAMKLSKGLNKRLRARSLTIQLLNEAIVHYIITKLDLPRANVIINAGSQAVILAPQTDPNTIQRINDSINEFLITQYSGYLRSVVTSYDTQLSHIYPEKKADSENTDEFQRTIIALKKKLTEDKHRMSMTIAYQLFDHDNPFRDAGINPGKRNKHDDEINDELADDETLFDEGKPNEKLGKEEKLGQKIVLLESKDLAIVYRNESGKFTFDREFERKTSSDNIFFLRFNTWWDSTKIENNTIAKSINLYVAKDGDSVKDFEKIADNDYLAYIKGDVDNMSLILQYGFGDEHTNLKHQYSISRIVSFARLLEYFFGVRTERFLKKEFENTSYTVFSGGDDFELIVKYSDAISLIQSYTKLFHEFVCQNPTIHFSLGMVLFKYKTPMHIVRKQAEACEKSAKHVGKEEMRRIYGIADTYKLHTLGIVDQSAKTTKALSYGGLCLYESGYECMVEWNKNKLEKIADTDGKLLDLGPYIHHPSDFFNTKTSQASGDTQIYTIYMLLGDMARYRTIANYAQYNLTGARILDIVTRGGGTEKLLTFIKQILLSFSLNHDKNFKELQGLRLKFLHYLHNKA